MELIKTSLGKYEEFIEGIKPIMENESDGSSEIGYKIVPGLFKELCSQAERDRRPSNKEYRRRYRPREYPFLADVISDKIPGRESDTETIFYDNNSAGLQFAAIGRLVYDRAKELGLGVNLPMEWFQQDIRN